MKRSPKRSGFFQSIKPTIALFPNRILRISTVSLSVSRPMFKLRTGLSAAGRIVRSLKPDRETMQRSVNWWSREYWAIMGVLRMPPISSRRRTDKLSGWLDISPKLICYLSVDPSGCLRTRISLPVASVKRPFHGSGIHPTQCRIKPASRTESLVCISLHDNRIAKKRLSMLVGLRF